MNRIYQGRVTKVEKLKVGKNGKSADDWEELKDWQVVLWQHHELFQDAVNYYTLALATMAKGLSPDTVESRAALAWRDEVCKSWNQATRKAIKFEGPHQRISKLLGLDPAKSDFDKCGAKLLRHTPSSAQQRAKALLQLLEEADKGDLNQICVARIRWFCTRHGALDATPKSVSHKQEIEMLKSIREVHESTSGNLAKVAAVLNVGYFLAQPPKNDIVGEVAIEEAEHQFEAALKKVPSFKKLENKFKSSIREQGKKLTVPNLGRKPKGAYSFALVFKLFPTPETWKALKDATAGSYKRSLKQTAFTSEITKDFIAEARTRQDEPIFDYLTNLLLTREADDSNHAVWFDFDLAAFIEAIKSPHRYFQDTLRREEQARKVREKLQAIDSEGKWLDVSIDKGKLKNKVKVNDSAEDEEDEAGGFTFKDDKRIKLIRQLVTDEKEGLAYLAEAENPEMEAQKAEYTIQERTLRGWPKIREGWRKLTDNKDWPKLSAEEQEKKLWAVAVAEQGEHRDDFGSSTLYKILTQAKYHPVWRDNGTQDDHADDPLRAWLQFTERRMELKDKERPIRFTPAHGVHSPRYFIFPKKYQNKSGKTSKRQVATRSFNSEHEKGVLVFAAGIIFEDNGKRQPVRSRIFYSAPRLRRDQLRSDGETDLTKARWLQPMMQAMGLGETEVTDFAKCRVTLQPESLRNIQLTFPVEVPVDKLKKSVGKESLWNRQFNLHPEGSNFYNATLRWPHEKQPVKPPKPWYEQMSAFTCLSVDLGQRDAGAYALLEARANHDFSKKPSRFIGETPRKRWRAVLAASGLLRLSGEDHKEWRANSSLDPDKKTRFAFREELFGERGRSATDAETKQCRELLAEFGVKKEDLMPADWENTLFFPEQNDKLLVAVRRAQSYVARLHRWCWFLSDDRKEKNIEKALEEIGEVKDERSASIRQLAKEKKQKELNKALRKELSGWLGRLPGLLEQVAQRCLPLRGRSWRWGQNPVKADCFILDQGGPEKPNASMKMPNGKEMNVTWIRGQRGLSFERIEQIEELRKRFQSLNQTLRRKIGSLAPKRWDDSIPDPCPDLLEKLDHLKEQRVNQTAHMILAEALGVRLTRPPANKDELRRTRDQHGAYERFRDPVDFIVIEDLSRYRASQGRAPRENSRLMKWSHRAVRNKLKELCEPFGIPVLETSAAYSSRFCSRSGVAGLRAVEVHPDMKSDFPWAWHLRRLQLYLENPQTHPLSEVALSESQHVEKLFQQLGKINKNINTERPKWRTLLAPMTVGPIFVPICDRIANPDHKKLQPVLVQSDINAAISIGLRAIADPRLWNIYPRLRTERVEKGDGLIAREKRKYGEKVKKPLNISEQAKPSKGDSRQPNFFFDVADCAKWGHATIEDPLDGKSVKLVSGKALWSTVKEQQWSRVEEINRRRIAAWESKQK